jgi:hypothetical protein
LAQSEHASHGNNFVALGQERTSAGYRSLINVHRSEAMLQAYADRCNQLMQTYQLNIDLDQQADRHLKDTGTIQSTANGDFK